MMIKRRVTWLLLALFAVVASSQAAETLVEGQDYRVLVPAQPTSRPDKIVVTEFFSYQCSHCFVFHPTVTAWSAKLPKDVFFEKVPVSLGHRPWQPIAQTFYALQALGKANQLDQAIFDAIHVQKTPLTDEQLITDWLATKGVKPADFAAAYHSFTVESNTKRAEQMMVSYKVQGTPSLVVDGKYVVLSEGTRSLEEWVQRTSRVIDMARSQRKLR